MKTKKQTHKKMEVTPFFSLYFKTGGCILLKKIDKWKSPLGGVKGSVCDDALVQGYTK